MSNQNQNAVFVGNKLIMEPRFEKYCLFTTLFILCILLNNNFSLFLFMLKCKKIISIALVCTNALGFNFIYLISFWCMSNIFILQIKFSCLYMWDKYLCLCIVIEYLRGFVCVRARTYKIGGYINSLFHFSNLCYAWLSHIKSFLRNWSGVN